MEQLIATMKNKHVRMILLNILSQEDYRRSTAGAGEKAPPTYEEAHAGAQAIMTAMKGWGTDEKKLIRIIARASVQEMTAYREAFNQTFKGDLIHWIRSECWGSFEDILIALAADRAEYDAHTIHDACEYFGTREAKVSEIICTRTMVELDEIAQAYERIYKQPLLKRLRNETGGHLRKIYETLLQSAMGMARGDKGKGTAPGNTTHEISGHETRLDPNNGKAYTKAEFVSVYGDTAIWDKARQVAQRSVPREGNLGVEGYIDPDHTLVKGNTIDDDVDKLYWAGEARWGTDEDVWIERLCTSSREYRTKLYRRYRQAYGKGLDVVIMDEMDGYGKYASHANALALLVTPLDRLFAERIFLALLKESPRAMKGVEADGLDWG
jgi:hypothetical protein